MIETDPQLTLADRYCKCRGVDSYRSGAYALAPTTSGSRGSRNHSQTTPQENTLARPQPGLRGRQQIRAEPTQPGGILQAPGAGAGESCPQQHTERSENQAW